jgi:glucokinase
VKGQVSVGIDLGGTKCLGVALDEDGTVVEEHRSRTPRGPAAVVDTLVEVVDALGPASSIGVGAPGLVDVEGVLRVAPNLPDVKDLPLRALLGERFPDAEVRIENDASAAAWGEGQAGATRGAPHAVMVTLGTGIGGGIIVDGRLLRGANGFAAEIGHMVVDPDGPPCPCGKRGCWEQLASGNALGRLGREAAAVRAAARMVELAGGQGEDIRGEHVTRAAAAGDEDARRVMVEYSHWIALGMTNLADVFDTGLFILGGGVVSAGDALLEPLRAAFATLLLAAEHRPPIPIMPAALGEKAGAIGAAMLARDARVAG